MILLYIYLTIGAMFGLGFFFSGYCTTVPKYLLGYLVMALIWPVALWDWFRLINRQEIGE